jgi:hypothetical protein
VPVSVTAPAFVVALRSQLLLRAGLAGVKVYLVAPGDTTINDAIVLVRDRIIGGQAWGALGRRRRDDSFRVQSALEAYKTGTDTQVVFQAAMDRAAVLLDEVVLELRDNPPQVGDQTRKAIVSEVTFQPLVSEAGGWVCRCEFVIDVSARVT